MKIGPARARQQSHTLRMHKKCTAQRRERNSRHARAHPMHENGTAQRRERNSRHARAHPMHNKCTAQQRERSLVHRTTCICVTIRLANSPAGHRPAGTFAPRYTPEKMFPMNENNLLIDDLLASSRDTILGTYTDANRQNITYAQR